MVCNESTRLGLGTPVIPQLHHARKNEYDGGKRTLCLYIVLMQSTAFPRLALRHCQAATLVACSLALVHESMEKR